MCQEAYTTKLITEHQMSNTSRAPTPYRSCMTVDDIPTSHFTPLEQGIIMANYQLLIGSLLWLTYTTGPDLCIVTSLLIQYINQSSMGQYYAAKYVLHYTSAASDHGITFSSNTNKTPEKFVGVNVTNQTSFFRCELGPTACVCQTHQCSRTRKSEVVVQFR
jgi:hypothetical protein